MRALVLSCLAPTLAIGIACDSSDDDPGVQDCSAAGQNEFVYNVMKETYLWYEDLPEVDPAKFESPAELLNELRNPMWDKWSFVTTVEQHQASIGAGKYVGFGYVPSEDESGAMRVAHSYTTSSSYEAGMRRGDRLVAFNSEGTDGWETVEAIEEGMRWAEVLGPSEPGVKVSVKVEKPDGTEATYEMKKGEVLRDVFLHKEVVTRGDRKIGYFVFDSFTQRAGEEIGALFSEFAAEGVNELVVDMRYNGGGLLGVAQQIASLAAGKSVVDETFITLKHNDKYVSWDESLPFTVVDNALDLKRVVFVTTERSCSASEAVISGLRPFLDVTVVGQKTCGKPVGMHGHTFCDKRLVPVQFSLVNAKGDGEYFQGIDVDCPGNDDLSSPFGEGEGLFAQSLEVIENGSCPVAVSSLRSRRKSFRHWPRQNGQIVPF